MTPDRVFRIARRCDVTGQTRLMSFGQLGDLAVECGQVKTELPQPPRRPNALFEAFDLVGECADGARRLCRTSVIGARKLSPGRLRTRVYQARQSMSIYRRLSTRR
jgi:hypothetical protein